MAKTKQNATVAAKQPVAKGKNPLVIGIVTLVIVAGLAAAVFYFGGFSSTGQAYNPNTERNVDSGDLDPSLSVYMQHGGGFAAPTDTVSIPVKIDNLEQNAVGVEQATICLDFEADKLRVSGLTVDAPGWAFLASPAGGIREVIAKLNNPAGVGACEGASQAVDITSGTGSPLKGNKPLFTIEFTVLGEPDVDVTTITMKVPAITGIGMEDLDNPDSTSELLIVETCPDNDLDGYASLPPGEVDNRELRACEHTNHLLAQEDRLYDCDDTNAGVKPGRSEQCNGLDDDCSDPDHRDLNEDGEPDIDPEEIDDGLDNLGLNVHPDGEEVLLAGVCFGYKTCVDGEPTNSWQALGDHDPENPSQPSYGDEVCDAFDNDCDGLLNEGFPGCLQGARVAGGNAVGKIVSETPGNTYFDYNVDGELGPQLLGIEDEFLFYAYQAELDSPSFEECGESENMPCGCLQNVEGGCDGNDDGIEVLDNTKLYYCKSGVYYLAGFADGELGDVYKFDPTGELPVDPLDSIPACD